MYLQALWSLIVFALLATAWLGATRAQVTAAARHAAMRAANLAVERAQDSLVETIAAQAASGATTFVPPTPSPPIPICPTPLQDAPCPFSVSTSASLAGETSGGGLQPNQTAYNLQSNSLIGEQRLAAVVTVVITARSGPVVGEFNRHLTLRTLAAWPYVAVSGADEPTVDGYTVGDFAGSCVGGACGEDSRIHAIEECSDPQQPQRCVGQTPQPVDDFNSRNWHDANADANGWSR